MADIRGLTVEISADATSFKKEIKQVQNESKNTQAELTALQKSLKLEFNPDTLVKAQQTAQKAIDETSAVADTLRQRLQFLEDTGNIDTTEYKRLQTELTQSENKVKELQKTLEELNNAKLDNVKKQINDFGNSAENAGKALSPLSVAAAGALTGLGAIGVKAVSTADEIATLADKYEMSAEALQRFNYVALQTDVENEQLYKAFMKVRSGVADLATETTSTAATALQKLKLDYDSFNGTEEQFYAIIDALSSMTNQTEMVALANDIFGDKLATNILPLIHAGTDAVNEYRDEFSTLGALTNEQVASFAAFDNVMNTIKTQFANVALQLGAALLPIMEDIAEFLSSTVIPKLQEFSAWFGNLDESTQKTILKLLAFIALAAPILIAVGKMSKGVSSLITLFQKFNTAQGKVALGFMSILAAAGLAFDMIMNWKSMSTIEKVLKSLALGALVAAAAITVFHAAASWGIAVGAIAAGIVAGIAAINAAREEILPETDDFNVSDFSTSNFDEENFKKKYGLNESDGETVSPDSLYDNVDTGVVEGDIYNYDYSTSEKTQNVTVVIENYAKEVDVDDLIERINIKLAEAM